MSLEKNYGTLLSKRGVPDYFEGRPIIKNVPNKIQFEKKMTRTGTKNFSFKNISIFNNDIKDECFVWCKKLELPPFYGKNMSSEDSIAYCSARLSLKP
jgi:hypothetical protein